MRLDHGRGQREPLLFVGFGEDALSAGIIDNVFIGDPVRHRDDDFVAWINERLRQIEYDVLAADADDALGWFVIGAEIRGVPLANRLLQLERSSRPGIFREIRLDGSNGGLFDVVGRRKIGFPGAKIHHIDALRAQLFGVCRNLHRRRNADR